MMVLLPDDLGTSVLQCFTGPQVRVGTYVSDNMIEKKTVK
jgi:hypothetical protein